MNIEQQIKNGVKEIVELLVKEEYRKLEEMNKIGVLTASELSEAILQYGEKLTLPPNQSFDEMDIFKLDNSQKYSEEYSIDFELWSNNRKSDLTLSCEATVNEKNEVNVTIYSVHVL
jgi:hypothetical protein